LTQKSAVYCWRNEAMIALAGKHFWNPQYGVQPIFCNWNFLV
jgi:hypothetical protein